MKQSIILFCLFISSIIYSQNVKIHGTVNDNTANSAVILSPAIYSKLIDSKLEFNPKKGYFEFNILIGSPCFYRLYYKDKRISLYLEPGTTVQLNVDNLKTEDYVSFYSDLSQENTILNQKNIPSIGTKEHREKFKLKAADGQQTYFYAVEAEMITQKNTFNKLVEEANLSQNFIEAYLRNNIEMAGVLYKYYYPRFAFNNIDSFIVSNPDFLKLFDEIQLNGKYNQSVLYYENQMNHHKALNNVRFKDQFLSKSVDDLILYKAYINNAFTLSYGQTKDYILENLIGEWIAYYGRTTDIKDEIVKYVDQLNDKDKKDLIKKKLVHLAQYESGKPAPIFSFEDNAGNIRNLKEFVGKIVYIDAWASWCGPCIAELPHAKTIYNKYKDNPDIVFLYISIDENKENWEKSMRERKLYDGIQGLSFPNGFNSDFARKYSIQGIPNYILIDKSGNLVTHRAPKPSQPEKLIPLLDKMLGLEK
jgi:thiol-disulfide isomerase/thioredoxin